MIKEFNDYPELERLYADRCFEDDKRRLEFYNKVAERSRNIK